MRNALPGVALCLLLLLGGSHPLQAAPLATPFDVYQLGPLPDAQLRPFAEAPGDWLALHQERVDGMTWVLLALPDGASASPPGAGERPRYLGRVRPGERIVLSAPDDGAARFPDRASDRNHSIRRHRPGHARATR